eukprot:CAMPEP_0182886466 /NCGR_PEP_ID=MMETSP0034_2-20130328/20235_1 /TAXON_ID=156128 /ORGANISM="Nephroselmis pyriformis, Strain CCMP717" /LENGTH=72 /DNA_ID=CAMNT_0025019791 /DNA_START=318 /DNA_END=533 /DNA_ORIENTATION=+
MKHHMYVCHWNPSSLVIAPASAPKANASPESASIQENFPGKRWCSFFCPVILASWWTSRLPAMASMLLERFM